MVTSVDGLVTTSNDGATVLSALAVEHPAARLLVQLSRGIDRLVGDGTTSVVLLASAILEHALQPLRSGSSAPLIIRGCLEAGRLAAAIVEELSIPVDARSAAGRELLQQAARTSLSSKLISKQRDLDHTLDCIVGAIVALDCATPPSRDPSAACAASLARLVRVVMAPVQQFDGHDRLCQLVPGLVLPVHPHFSRLLGPFPRAAGARSIAMLRFSMERPVRVSPRGVARRVSAIRALGGAARQPLATDPTPMALARTQAASLLRAHATDNMRRRQMQRANPSEGSRWVGASVQVTSCVDAPPTGGSYERGASRRGDVNLLVDQQVSF
jgi:hypothetical protein